VSSIVAEGMVRRSLLRAVIGIAAADVLMVGGAVSANAEGMPKVYTRKDWGAVPPKHPPKVLERAPDHIIVHHTASPNVGEASKAHAFALSKQIQHFHMESRGWDDIGEQLTIGRGGHVMEGRSGSLDAIERNGLVVGAQSLHHNKHTLGIENEGTYMKDDVPERLWSSLVEVCVWLCSAHGLDPKTAIVGHRDYNSTDCPGDVLYRRLPELRKKVARALDKRNEDDPPDAGSDDRRGITSRHHHRTTRR
jgi:hypothetical protein